MSYNVVQKIRNNYYLYEVTAEWDPETKKSKQSRKYIGKCDADGNLLATNDNTIIIRNLGEHYLLHNICKKCGLWNAMCKVFGEDGAAILFAHAVSRAARSCPPTQASYDIKGSILPEYFGIPLDSKLLTLEGYLNYTTHVYNKRYELFKELVQDKEATVYAIDNMLRPIQFYKLYGQEGHDSFNYFPQKAIFIAQGTEHRIPFYLRLANYSDADLGTLKDITDELKDMGVDKTTFYLGTRDYSEIEISQLIGWDYDLVVSLTPGSEHFMKYVEEAGDFSGGGSIIHDNLLYRYKKYARTYGFNECSVYVVHNGRAYEEAVLSFYKKLAQFEETVSGLKWTKTIEMRLETTYGFDDIMKYFKIGRGEGDSVTVERRTDEIRKYESRMGRYVIISDSEYDLPKLLSLIQRKDRLRQDISIFRTDLQGGGALFPSNDSALGSLMGDFFSTILKTALINRVGASDIGRSLNYLDVISMAESIKGYWINGVFGMTGPTPEQIEMFRALGIDPPSVSMMKEKKVR